MLQDKDRIYFKGILLKKMRITIKSSITLESLKVDEYEKRLDLLNQATLNYSRNVTLLLLEKNNVKIEDFKCAI